MSIAVRTALAVIAGFVVGSAVNMVLIMISGRVIPPPAGADVTTMEGLKASLHLFQPRHFLFPFLAHALGTLAGALAAAWLSPSRPLVAAFIVGALFLAGGLVNAFTLPSPAWFVAADLLLAYLPAAWLGATLASGLSRRSASGGA